MAERPAVDMGVTSMEDVGDNAQLFEPEKCQEMQSTIPSMLDRVESLCQKLR